MFDWRVIEYIFDIRTTQLGLRDIQKRPVISGNSPHSLWFVNKILKGQKRRTISCHTLKAAPSTHSRKNRLLLAIFSNFTKIHTIPCYFFFSEINKINRNYFDFRFDRNSVRNLTMEMEI